MVDTVPESSHRALSGREVREVALALAQNIASIVKIVKIVKTVAQCVTGRGHNGPAVPPSHTNYDHAGQP